MTLLFNDRVRETSSTMGTGTLTLNGSPAGFQTFSAGIGNSNTCYYCIQAVNSSGIPTGDWEVGLGIVSVGALSRDTVYQSSNSNSLVNFSGSLQVFNTIPSYYLGTTLPGTFVKLDGTSTTTASIPFAQGATFAAFTEVAYAGTPTFRVRRPGGEGWTISMSASQITQTFNNGAVDPDYLTWTSTLLAFSSTLRGYQLDANCPTGTIPVVVTSTTKCTNLNADQVDNAHVGTSGAAIPLLNGTNTFSGVQSFSQTIKANNTSKPLDILDANGLNYASIIIPSLGGAISLTMPTSTTTMAGLAITQSFTGTNTFTQTILATNTTAGVRMTGSLGGLISISAGAASGNTTFTIPSTTTTAAGLGIAQTFTQDQTISKTTPKLVLTDAGGDDYEISVTSGVLAIRNTTDGRDDISIGNTGILTHGGPVVLKAGTASAGFAPVKFVSGTNLTTGEAGAMEYNGTNLFFTRTGTAREGVLVGNRGAAAPATNTIGVLIDYYGTSATRALTTPNTWFSVVGDDGNTYKIPAYS